MNIAKIEGVADKLSATLSGTVIRRQARLHFNCIMVSEPTVCPNVSDVPGSLIVLCLYILSGADVCSDVHVYEHTCGSQRTILVVPTQAEIWVASSGATYLFKMLTYTYLFLFVCMCHMYVCICVHTCTCNSVCMP